VKRHAYVEIISEGTTYILGAHEPTRKARTAAIGRRFTEPARKTSGQQLLQTLPREAGGSGLKDPAQPDLALPSPGILHWAFQLLTLSLAASWRSGDNRVRRT
jgi:hypothetical protein